MIDWGIETFDLTNTNRMMEADNGNGMSNNDHPFPLSRVAGSYNSDERQHSKYIRRIFLPYIRFDAVLAGAPDIH